MKPRVVVLQAANDISLLTQYRREMVAGPDVGDPPPPVNLEPRFVDHLAWPHYLGQAADAEEAHLPYPPDKMLANVDRVLAERLDECGREGVAVVVLPVDPFYYHGEPEARSASLPQWPRWNGFYRVWSTIIDQLNDHLAAACRRRTGPASSTRGRS